MSQELSLVQLLAMPFLLRALLAGLLSGLLGGLLGGFAVLRQLSFFTDALGHAALLGIALGVLLGLEEPTVVLLPFAVLFALGVNHLAQRSQLPGDALLNIIYSSALALAVLVLSRVPGWQGGIEPLLFGDILGVTNRDLLLLLLLLGVGLYLLLTGRRQILLSVDEPLAISRGVDAVWQRRLFVVVLAVVVAISIKAVGVLLISAFVVIPACASRLVSRRLPLYLLGSALLGGVCALLGLLGSGLTNLPSGPCVVIVQFTGFLLALLISQWRQAPGLRRPGPPHGLAPGAAPGNPPGGTAGAG
jgi:zinc/manganese transport system permease protein